MEKENKWRILIDLDCGCLRLTMLNPKLELDDIQQLLSDLTLASLDLTKKKILMDPGTPFYIDRG